MADSFSRIEYAQYQHRLGKKLGYAVTGMEMGSVFNQGAAKKSSGLTQSQDIKKFDSSGHVNFQSLAPSAGRDVTNAWYQAAAATGVNGFDGSDTQLSVLFAMQAEQKAATGSSDLLGATKESAAAVVKKAIKRLEGMSGETVNTKVQEYRAKELSFYQELLTRLEND